MAKRVKKLEWTKEEIRAKLASDDQWLTRGLMAIYSYQTAEEQNAGATVEDNGMGFNGIDADFLTEMAQKFTQYGRLTTNQIEWTRKKMLKYSGQLARHANLTKPKVAE